MIRGFKIFACTPVGGLALALLAPFSDAHASAGHYDVAISSTPTHNMALNKGVYSPTGDNAVLNVGDLTNALNAGNLEVTTGKEPGDIGIEAAFHWVSSYALTLDAFHSIRVDQPVTDAGTGALTLTTNDGGANGHLEFGSGGNIQIWGLSNALTINGKTYTLVNSVSSLAAAIASNAGGNYALASSYDASVDRTYKQDPIATSFSGNFEGLGNAISNVSMRFTGGNIGFLNTIGAGASVSNFHLRNIATFVSAGGVGAVGGLAGVSYGALRGDDVSGTVTARNGDYLGGLIGTGSGSIVHCSALVTVRAIVYGGYIGTGGLVGFFTGTIDHSFATGNVSGGYVASAVGGLVGSSAGSISHSRATGSVSGIAFGKPLGGLVGTAFAPISDSYATGKLVLLVPNAIVGGLVGETSSSVTRSFAAGSVNIEVPNIDGGLVGIVGNASRVTDSYAIGAVTGSSYSATGGLVGQTGSASFISTSYAAAKIKGDSQGGGFACGLPEFSNDYWDTTTSGTTYGICGNTNISGVTGLTTTQLQSGLPAGFDPKIWAQDRKINRGFPYLIANPPPQ